VRIKEAERLIRRREKYPAGISAQYIWCSIREREPTTIHQRGGGGEDRIQNRREKRMKKRE